eukprot:1533678-Rhodomonas_salina.1
MGTPPRRLHTCNKRLLILAPFLGRIPILQHRPRTCSPRAWSRCLRIADHLQHGASMIWITYSTSGASCSNEPGISRTDMGSRCSYSRRNSAA